MQQDDIPIRIDGLLNEIWIHIFDFLEWNEVCKASTSTSLKLSRSLLVDDHQELFYRQLCLRSMKKDMKQVIDNILNRDIQFPLTCQYNTVVPATNARSFASPLPSHSMKQLRNRLEYQSNQLYDYFPEVYNEYSDAITHALNYSHSACMICTSDTSVQEMDEYGVNILRPKVKSGYSFQFKKKNKTPKWKSIWNGYSKDSAKHKVLDLIKSIPFWETNGPHHRVTRTDIPVDYTLLKNLLIPLPPQLRHSILFKTNYSQFKQSTNYKPFRQTFKANSRFKQPSKFEHCSSDLIGYLIYDLKRRTTIDYDAFFDLLDYLIEESKIFYSNYKSLTKDIIPNCSAVNYLLRYCRSVDHLATFLTKYAFIIRNQSQANRLHLLVECFKSSVDLRIINQMICLRIIDIDTVKQKRKSKENKLVTIAYYITCNAFGYGKSCTEYYNYLIEFTNLIIGISNSDRPNPNYPSVDCSIVYEIPYVEPESTDHLLRLRNFAHVSLFKRMVNEEFAKRPFPPQKPSYNDPYANQYYNSVAENPMLKAFFGQYYKYCHEPPKRDKYYKTTKQYDDDIPLDEFVGFERYKFGKLRDLRRRK